ncbi:MAG: hypothetical protein EXR75_11160 [Myxococcales bacterium]|nr:hypothetical protein [Myxococcales bacterium]
MSVGRSLVTRATVASLLASLLAGCGGEVREALCTDSGATRGMAVTYASFARQLDDTTAEGLNLDGVTSDGSGALGCYKTDFVSPTGAVGIDNQLATLLPLVEEFVGTENIEALLGAAIKNGQLLIVMNVRGIDDVVNDACVDIAFGTGRGVPLLDANGEYEPAQTFSWNAPDDPVSVLRKGRIEHGVLRAGPGSLVLPVRVLDADFALELSEAHIEATLTMDATGNLSLQGLAGGGIDVAELGAVVSGLNIGEDVKGAVVPLVKGRADLAMDADGYCHAISAALLLETTPAFVLE